MYLVLNEVVKELDGKKVIVNGTFTFEKGKIYGLLGRNGAGKTTLFNCISKNMLLDGGTILFAEDGAEPRDYQNTEIGFVHATPHLPGFMTGFEFVRFFLDINRERIGDVQHPKYYLDLVGIEERDQHRLLKDYSHGMQNKVQMIATMMTKPEVILLDEPLTSFDVVAAHEMKELIKSMKSDSVIIFSTHILQLAQDLCDEIVLLHNGELTGIPAEQIHDADFEDEVVKLLSATTATEVAEPTSLLLSQKVGAADDEL